MSEEVIGKDSMLFLLGGHDLEMLTIREVLQAEGVKYADHHLKWNNALLSSYREELLEAERYNQTVCGVELQEDMAAPVCYHRIDHHNQLAHLPSALEQVMQLLRLPMNRYQQLVAVNDRAYIPGLLQVGATSQEVENVRRADRRAQGVTEEQEELAVRALTENCRKVGALWVVRAGCQAFSPICDRLYPYSKLLVYTDREWMYYGEGAMRVRDSFAEDLALGHLFCGGGENGYVGAKVDAYSDTEIERMVGQIIRNEQ